MKNARIKEKMVFCRAEQIHRPLDECMQCGHFLRIEEEPATMPMGAMLDMLNMSPHSKDTPEINLPPAKSVVCGLPTRVEVSYLMEEVKDGRTDV
jgi:hypothetical protein